MKFPENIQIVIPKSLMHMIFIGFTPRKNYEIGS